MGVSLAIGGKREEKGCAAHCRGRIVLQSRRARSKGDKRYLDEMPGVALGSLWADIESAPFSTSERACAIRRREKKPRASQGIIAPAATRRWSSSTPLGGRPAGTDRGRGPPGISRATGGSEPSPHGDRRDPQGARRTSMAGTETEPRTPPDPRGRGGAGAHEPAPFAGDGAA